uniref:F-box domain-containing protein n=1 Tax=Caenorhabditis tropicalis TaxID=1561998 RepID=A0A1I7T287_9PELO
MNRIIKWIQIKKKLEIIYETEPKTSIFKVQLKNGDMRHVVRLCATLPAHCEKNRPGIGSIRIGDTNMNCKFTFHLETNLLTLWSSLFSYPTLIDQFDAYIQDLFKKPDEPQNLKLLDLPLLVQHEILKEMKFQELLLLSTLSKRAANNIRAVRFKKMDIVWDIKEELTSTFHLLDPLGDEHEILNLRTGAACTCARCPREEVRLSVDNLHVKQILTSQRPSFLDFKGKNAVFEVEKFENEDVVTFIREWLTGGNTLESLHVSKDPITYSKRHRRYLEPLSREKILENFEAREWNPEKRPAIFKFYNP